MITTIATFALGALLAAFAVCAVLLNEGQHAARRRRRTPDRSPADGSAPQLEAIDLSATAPRDGRRLPVGDFLFGVLYLHGEEPLAFTDLTSAALDSGLDINQTLIWLARAEESGLVERIPQGGEPGGQPAVRLTEEGMTRARNNRRSVRSADRARS